MPANGKILRERAFERMWNAAGGGRYRRRDRRCPRRLSPAWPPGPRTPRTSGDAMRGSYLGPEYSQAEIEARLKSTGAVFEDDNALIEASGQALAEGKALGWHQGRMEFGPRALGARIDRKRIDTVPEHAHTRCHAPNTLDRIRRRKVRGERAR